MQAPVLILNSNAKREVGMSAQLGNIAAAMGVSGVIRTSLGPRSMLKMILDPMGGIVMTNDGNAILREIEVSHPAAKSMIELARTQDEEVGDGTTSVIILAGELLSKAKPILESKIHPRIIVGAFMRALDDSLSVLKSCCLPLDITQRSELLQMVRSCLGTKFVSRFGDLVANLALDSVLTIVVDRADGTKEIDFKRYARIEKIPGGFLEESKVLDGVMLNKDVTHPQMRRKIVSPRILLLDCNLEYKKAESQTNIELKKEEDFEIALRVEEEYIERICQSIISLKPDIVCTEKGVSDLAQHFLQKANISVLRRLRKTDNNRVARATGATIVSVPEEAKESDLGLLCGLFDIQKIGDEYFSYFIECQKPKACSILLRGGSKDILNEIERNLLDAMNVVRNIVLDPQIVPGGGATEIAISQYLMEKSKSIEGVMKYPYQAVAMALEVIPRTLIENCGASPIRLLTQLRAIHAKHQSQQNTEKGEKEREKKDEKTAGGNSNLVVSTWGIDGNKGELVDMRDLKVFEPLAVKSQTIKTAIEAACLLLRIDEIVSGMSSKVGQGGGGQQQQEDEDTFGDSRDG